MKKDKIYLFEPGNHPYGLVIAAMRADYVLTEEVNPAFDPHRHAYHSLFVLTTGFMQMQVDAQQISMQAKSMLLLNPGQVHCCLHTEAISGWILFFDGKFLDPKARAVLEQPTNSLLYFTLAPPEFSFFDQVLHLIHQLTLATTPGIFQLQLLQSFINSLYYKAANLYKALQHVGPSYASRPVEITQNFKNLIKNHYQRLKKPADYAALLHISVSYLNDAVKAIMGFPATYFIQQETMGEAQRQLLYTASSVKEIAFLLGYKDPKYFIRLFTKVTTLAPTAFRITYRRNPAGFLKTVLLFKTSVSSAGEATRVMKDLLKLLPEHQINFDLEDCDCVLRLEGVPVNPDLVVKALHRLNHLAEEIND